MFLLRNIKLIGNLPNFFVSGNSSLKIEKNNLMLAMRWLAASGYLWVLYLLYRLINFHQIRHNYRLALLVFRLLVQLLGCPSGSDFCHMHLHMACDVFLKLASVGLPNGIHLFKMNMSMVNSEGAHHALTSGKCILSGHVTPHRNDRG